MSNNDYRISQLRDALHQMQNESAFTRRMGQAKFVSLLESDIRKLSASQLHRATIKFSYYDFPVAQELDDIIQTVWLVIFQAVENFSDVDVVDVETSLAKWLRTIVRNSVYSYLRGNFQYDLNFSLDTEDENELANVEKLASQDDVGKRVAEDLDLGIWVESLRAILTSPEWDVLYSYAVEEYSFKEMEAMYHQNTAALRKRKQYAIKKALSYFDIAEIR